MRSVVPHALVNSRQGKGREVLLHKILGVAHFVAHFAAKTAQNRLNRCTGRYRKLLICLRTDSA
jgi:hypothetical protein